MQLTYPTEFLCTHRFFPVLSPTTVFPPEVALFPDPTPLLVRQSLLSSNNIGEMRVSKGGGKRGHTDPRNATSDDDSLVLAYPDRQETPR
jgi:hypothetical protein